MTNDSYQPIDTAAALGIYFHNSSPSEIAASICEQFDDDPALLTRILCGGSGSICRLPPKAAKIVVDLAMEKYGPHAIARNTANGVRD